MDSYLSAENLARLDETNAEEDQSDDGGSADGSGFGDDADSFHSAMSLGGQKDLADALQDDIRQAEGEIEALKGEVEKAGRAYRDKFDSGALSEADRKRHRALRNEMKIELLRAEAELKALRAAYRDMMTQLAAAKQFNYEQKLNGTEGTPSEASASTGDREASRSNDAVLRAHNLLKARQMRPSSKPHFDTQHNLTRHLNRDLFFGSISVGRIAVQILGGDESGSSDGDDGIILELSVEGLTTTLHQRAFDSRLYSSAEQILAMDGPGGRDDRVPPLLYGGRSDDGGTLASQYPHLVSSDFMQDKFLRLALEIRRRPRPNRADGDKNPPGRSGKAKISLGVIEFSPDAGALARCVGFAQHAKTQLWIEPVDPSQLGSLQPSSSSPSVVHKLKRVIMGSLDEAVSLRDGAPSSGSRSDLTLHINALNVRLSDDGRRAIGAVCLTGMGMRHSRVVASPAVYGSRGQIDVRLSNAQLLDLHRSDPSQAREVLGRRDMYRPLLQARARVQMVDADDLGGWAVEGEERAEVGGEGRGGRAWNMHLGAKSQPIGVTALGASAVRVLKQAQKLLGSLRPSGRADEPLVHSKQRQAEDSTPILNGGTSWSLTTHTETLPLRWRIDFALNKISVAFPCGHHFEGSQHDVGPNMCLALSQFHTTCIQEDNERNGAVSLQCDLKDLRLFRAFDDWLILEPITATCEATLPSSMLFGKDMVSGNHRMAQLKLPPSSQWLLASVPKISDGQQREMNGGLSYGLSYAHDAAREEPTLSRILCFSVAVTPILINVSAHTCCLLIDAVEELKSGLGKEMGGSRSSANEEKEDTIEQAHYQSTMQVSTSSIDIKLHEETQVPVGMPHKIPKALVSIKGMSILLSCSLEERSVSLNIKEVSLFDISSYPRVCVFGPPKAGGCEAQQGNIDFSLSVIESKEKGVLLVLDLGLGCMQCIIVPSLLRCFLDLEAAVKDHLLSKESPSRNQDSLPREGQDFVKVFSLPCGARCLRLSVKVAGFDLILSSRYIPAYIQMKATEPISVISSRWKSNLIGIVATCEKQDIGNKVGYSVDWLNSMIVESGADVDAATAWNSILAECEQKETDERQNLSKVLATRLHFELSDFQILRTCVRRLSPHELEVMGIDPSVCCFVLSPPVAGEQQILSPLDSYFAHTLTASCFDVYPSHNESVRANCAQGSGPYTTVSNISQALQIDVGCIDVLLYIRQSVGGMNEAFRVSVLPILEMLKREERKREARHVVMPQAAATPLSPGVSVMGHQTPFIVPETPKPEPPQALSPVSPLDLMKASILVTSIRVAGICVVLVPSGSTRLTENPIMKVSITAIKSGLGVIPVPQVGSSSFPLGNHLSNLMASSWMECEIAAHYHNMRLVEWEPVIEPWTVSVRFGCDLTRSLNLAPLQCVDLPLVDRTPTEQRRPSLSTLIQESIHDRNISRLLRFPSVGSYVDRDSSGKHQASLSSGFSVNPLQYSSHVSHLLLYLMQSECLQLALCPMVRVGQPPSEIGPNNPYLDFSSGRWSDWLHSHGYPQANDSKPMALVSVSDNKPLNLNLSGALIENVELVLNELKLSEASGINKPLAPHWIRNDSGLSIRFQEIFLDPERVRRGERSKAVILGNGSEIALSLKRDISQSCDPHRAYISLELGFFGKDTCHGHAQWTKGVLRTKYKACARIPVDMVGVYQFNCSSVEQQMDTFLGDGEDATVIVRVALNGGTKIVAIESPLVLKNLTDSEVYCEAKTRSGAKLWSATLPPMADSSQKVLNKRVTSLSSSLCIPVPMNLVPLSDLGLVSFSVHTDMSGNELYAGFELPKPFSKKTASRGVIGATEITVSHTNSLRRGISSKHLNACSLRIGRFSLDAKTKVTHGSSSVFIPEQRMVVFRPPVVLKNHLPFPITVQVRAARSASSGSTNSNVEAPKSTSSQKQWDEIGVIQCGEAVSWMGATAKESVEFRIKLSSDSRGGGRFPTWSSPFVIPSEVDMSTRSDQDEAFASKIIVKDGTLIPLELSVALGGNTSVADSDSTPQDNVKTFAANFVSAAPRIAAIFVPYWLVDGTGLDLEYTTEVPIAGQTVPDMPMELLPKQSGNEVMIENGDGSGSKLEQEALAQAGLVDLLQDENFAYLEGRNIFDVHMIGDERSNRLSILRRVLHRRGNAHEAAKSPWSDPIALRAGNSHQRITVRPPVQIPWLSHGSSLDLQVLALDSHIVPAPERFGGQHGTKLVHVVNRYEFVNALDRDIEIVATRGSKSPVTISHRGHPFPFHFDDASSLRFRPKEFGWGWSGPFSLRKNRKEVVLRLRNKLTQNIIIATIEFFESAKTPGMTAVFRAAIHPPFRLENHSLHPLQFGQSSYKLESRKGVSALGEVTYLLPYHSANYAWDEPDESMRTVFIELADFGLNPEPIENQHLGIFGLDHLVPGTKGLKMVNSMFVAEIVADGPTRVLRISDSSLPKLSAEHSGEVSSSFMNLKASTHFHHQLEVKLDHGIGISVIDWSPQELAYIRMQGVCLERKVVSGVENVNVSVSSVSVDNQLWVTPYPVLLKIDSQETGPTRRRRKTNAISLSWCRELTSYGGLDTLMLIRSVALSTEQLKFRIDGNLINLLQIMLSETAGARSVSTPSLLGNLDHRDVELLETLGLQRPGSSRNNDSERGSYSRKESEIVEDSILTAATASKATSQPSFAAFNRNDLALPKLSSPTRKGARFDRTRKAPKSSMTKARRKLYIEKIKISTVKTEVSWTGMLPLRLATLPSFMRPALTFEGLPVMLRPYSDAHAYGSLEEHVQRLKSHYFNIWRVIDLVVGLTFKPTFMIRACLFTWEQTAASIFDTLSDISSYTAGQMSKWIPMRETGPSYVLEDQENEIVSQRHGERMSILEPNAKHHHSMFFFNGIIGKVMGTAVSFFQGSSTMSKTIASSLRYDGGSYMLEGSQTKEADRVRAPRLFANQEGKDLLVEYVEGENAGKALLSRVRMGTYLGEGCIYHGYGAHLWAGPSSGDRTSVDNDSDSLIFIMTSERILLLKGSGNLNFCSIAWEVCFDHIVLLEMTSDMEGAQAHNEPFDVVECWYLNKEVGGDEHHDKQEITPGTSSRCTGLGSILFKSIHFPCGTGKILLSELYRVAPRFGEKFAS